MKEIRHFTIYPIRKPFNNMDLKLMIKQIGGYSKTNVVHECIIILNKFFFTRIFFTTYCIAGFYCENFILASHGIRNIKICCYFYLVT